MAAVAINTENDNVIDIEASNVYIPESANPFRLQTEIPANMVQEVRASLLTIRRISGNVDEWVRKKLKYTDLPSLWAALAAEQVDGVALAIHQIENGSAFIIGDMTGIGKGRQAAAIVRYCVVNGIKCAFLTKTGDLFSDMWRDLIGIKFDSVVPYIVNSDTGSNLVDDSYESEDDNRFVWKRLGRKYKNKTIEEHKKTSE